MPNKNATGSDRNRNKHPEFRKDPCGTNETGALVSTFCKTVQHGQAKEQDQIGKSKGQYWREIFELSTPPQTTLDKNTGQIQWYVKRIKNIAHEFLLLS